MQKKEVQEKRWRSQSLVESKWGKGIIQIAQSCNLAGEIQFVKNHVTFFSIEKV